MPAAPPAPGVALKFDLRRAEEVAHFSAEPFVAGGLAYDAVSRRFLFADVLGRRLIVLGEGSDTTVDLVREAGARFQDVTALEIDTKRGDLWVGEHRPRWRCRSDPPASTRLGTSHCDH